MIAWLVIRLSVPAVLGVVMLASWWALPGCDAAPGPGHDRASCRECSWTARAHWIVWAISSAAWLLWGRR